MAGRVSAWDTDKIRLFREEMEAKAAALAAYRADMAEFDSYTSSGGVRSSMPALVEPALIGYGQYEGVVAANAGLGDDDGYCYTAMVSGPENLANLKTLGPSPSVGELLSAPLTWFSYPLVGVVTSAGSNSCRIRSGSGHCGLALDRFLTVAAMKRVSWPGGSLGAELTGGRLEGALAGSTPGTGLYSDTVMLKEAPGDLPSHAYVVTASVGALPGLRLRYPQCTVVGPGQRFQARDVVYFPCSSVPSDDELGRVLDSVSRSFVWVSTDVRVPEIVKERHRGLYARPFESLEALEHVRVGPEGAVDTGGTIVDADGGGYIDDGNYLLLCQTQATKVKLQELFAANADKVLTVSEAQGLVVADVYLFTEEAVWQTSACPQVVVRDRSELVGGSVTGATRGFFLMDSALG